jgi:hypothetical protein
LAIYAYRTRRIEEGGCYVQARVEQVMNNINRNNRVNKLREVPKVMRKIPVSGAFA